WKLCSTARTRYRSITADKDNRSDCHQRTARRSNRRWTEGRADQDQRNGPRPPFQEVTAPPRRANLGLDGQPSNFVSPLRTSWLPREAHPLASLFHSRIKRLIGWP